MVNERDDCIWLYTIVFYCYEIKKIRWTMVKLFVV